MQTLSAGVRIAWEALLANKLRTMLTLLGNIVGIMSVIAVVSLLGGVDNYMRQEVASEGTSVFTIQRVNSLAAITDFDGFVEALRRNPYIVRDDVEQLRSRLQLADVVSASVSSATRVGYRERFVGNITVDGRDAEYPFIDNFSLSTGRHISRLEDSDNAQVAVIGWEVYTSLIEPRNPIGETVRIGDRHFTVVGVAADRGTLLGGNRNRFVVVPLGTYRKLFGPGQSLQVSVRSRDIRQMDEAVEEATVTMRILHRLRPADDNDFAVSTSQQLIDLWKNISQGVMLALVCLVGISMLVGGIVLMNTMLVSVTERTREIGLRKAIGAPRAAIVWQFLVESATLSLFGGVVGVAIGFTIAAAVSLFTVLPYVVNVGLVVAAFLITIAIGLVFGTYPALKASRLDPVEALRAE